MLICSLLCSCGSDNSNNELTNELTTQQAIDTNNIPFSDFANDNVDWNADTWVLSEDYEYFYLSEIAIDDVVSGKSTYLFNDNISRWYYTSNHFSTDEIYVYSLLWIYADKRIEPCHKDDPDSYIRLDTSIKTNICVWLPLSYVERYYNSQVNSNDNINSFDISNTLSLLNLTSKEVSVSDSTDIGLSQKMMKDYISYGGKGETYYSLGRCDGVEGGFLQNGYAFVTADQIDKEYIEYFYYAIPDNSALYLCYVDSEVHICWKNNLPSNVDKATQFVKSVIGEEIPLENIQSNGFYTFWHNDGMLYVNWECNQIFVSTDDGGKTQIYPTDTIGYFQ